MRELKVVVLGSGGVGKSALSVQFVSDCFIEKYDPTIDDFYRKEIEVDDDSTCVFEILNTAATEQFASKRDLHIKNGHVFIVMYSLTNHQSFQDISNMKNVISRVKGSEPAPILLVANKVDLECQREVSRVAGKGLAKQWDCPFIEASAKDRINVVEAFATVFREMIPIPSRTKRTSDVSESFEFPASPSILPEEMVIAKHSLDIIKSYIPFTSAGNGKIMITKMLLDEIFNKKDERKIEAGIFVDVPLYDNETTTEEEERQEYWKEQIGSFLTALGKIGHPQKQIYIPCWYIELSWEDLKTICAVSSINNDVYIQQTRDEEYVWH